MLEPVNKNETPPGGYKYLDPRTGIQLNDNSIFGIYPRVSRAWFANDIEFPDNWKAVVDHEICLQNPQMESREIGTPDYHITIQDIERFGSSVKNWVAGGMKFVSLEEAEGRAAICVSCHENKPMNVCLGCHGALKWMSERVGWPQTKLDGQLQGCRRCRCLLRLKVQMPLGTLDNTGIEYPSHCWQNPQPSTTAST